MISAAREERAGGGSRDFLAADLAEFGIGAGVLVPPFVVYNPPRTARTDQANAAAMRELRPLLAQMARSRWVIR
ncbi:hypothetical protein [Burkholderia multivorans]|uniref:Uncharacterized protein n=1 Tax=Burkholderia multivorans TaxID=87883 RepID=A0A2S9MSS0_9BURK|nr:hypothetical protein [Burkholderia multivorans]MBU9511753.1 hypothetical protein [Burkholderia multivorans]MBU9539346.1 hypothetical protein [Burkholderia multivorans]MBU9634920.1 hypothetical protein [Burkholderia multivorans]PRF00712.1 hypothetical protein C6Q07_24665 [Burkholderia multivorans]PRF62017.1 hypothetical protein C6Q15_10430 [Burkholderia multivorans]